MARLFELCGPAGIGKSSLYDAVRERWNKKTPWVTYDDLYHEERTVLWRLHRRIRLLLNGGDSESSREDSRPKRGKIATGRRFFRENPAFSSTLMDLIHQHSGKGFDETDRRLLNIHYFIPTMIRVQTVKEKVKDERPCLMDEGLISRIMHLNSPSFDERALFRYLKHLPPPEALFLLDAPTEDIVDRIVERERVATVHSGLDAESLRKITSRTRRFLEITRDELSARGVTVYPLDARKATAELADEVIRILSS